MKTLNRLQYSRIKYKENPVKGMMYIPAPDPNPTFQFPPDPTFKSKKITGSKCTAFTVCLSVHEIARL